jgi:hypothetical protein
VWQEQRLGLASRSFIQLPDGVMDRGERRVSDGLDEEANDDGDV